MSKIAANALRAGMLIDHKDALWRVVSSEHVKVSGRGGAGMQVELKSLSGNSKLSHRFRTDEKVTRPHVDSHRMQYLYDESGAHVFMDSESFEQVTIESTIVESISGYLLPGMEVFVDKLDGSPISVSPPAQVELEIVSTEPRIKGATATSSYKPAVTNTGMTVMVPPFIKQGETIKVNTATGEYLERSS